MHVTYINHISKGGAYSHYASQRAKPLLYMYDCRFSL